MRMKYIIPAIPFPARIALFGISELAGIYIQLFVPKFLFEVACCDDLKKEISHEQFNNFM